MEVHHDDVWVGRQSQSGDVGHGVREARDLEVGLAAEQHPESVRHQLVIVDDDDAERSIPILVGTVGRHLEVRDAPALAVPGHLVNRRRTKELAGIPVLLRTSRMTDVRLQDVQVTRLILVVRRP